MPIQTMLYKTTLYIVFLCSISFLFSACSKENQKLSTIPKTLPIIDETSLVTIEIIDIEQE